MKLTRISLAMALLLCTLVTPAVAQQTQQQAGEQTEQARPNNRRPSRNYTGGRFMMDLNGQQPAFLDQVGGKGQTPTVQDQNAASAAAARPAIPTGPGAVVIAPAADDKDDD